MSSTQSLNGSGSMKVWRERERIIDARQIMYNVDEKSRLNITDSPGNFNRSASPAKVRSFRKRFRQIQERGKMKTKRFTASRKNHQFSLTRYHKVIKAHIYNSKEDLAV